METTVKVDNSIFFNIYYIHKKMTKNQYNFVYELSRKILNINQKNLLIEIPPTLDKDFLYCSVLFSLYFYKLLQKKKIIIIVNDYEKIRYIYNNFNILKKHFSQKENNNNKITIIPFYERKYTCFNEESLSKSNSFDFDNYCIEMNASFKKDNKKCIYYNNLFSNNFNCSFQLNLDFNLEEQINLLKNSKLCSFYYNSTKIIKGEYDIIICLFKDFFDCRRRVSIQKMINYENNESNYFLLFDEVNNLENILINNFSNLIDEDLITNARIEVFNLGEKIKKFDRMNDNMEIDNEIDNKFILSKPELEILNYNLLIDDPNTNNINGSIRNSHLFLNVLSKLLVYFFEIFEKKKKERNYLKEEEITSIYSFQYDFLQKFWLEFSTIKQLFKKLISQFNDIRFFNYSEMYHLIHFIFFLCHMGKFTDYKYIINLSNYRNLNSNKLYLELYLMEPSNFIQKLNTKINNNSIYLSGGIGKLEIFCNIFKLESISLIDDYYKKKKKNNLFFTSIGTTTPTNKIFYGETLKKISQIIPDGIIVYFSSNKLLKEYVEKWNSHDVFNFILDYKLIFIEEKDPIRLSKIIVNYKKSISLGRGGILLISIRNKSFLIDGLLNEFSKGIVFIGFPIETNVNKILEFKVEYYRKLVSVISDEFLKYDAFKLFTLKIINKIYNSLDKKIIVVLEDKLLSENNKEFLPNWLKEIIHPEEDDDNNNIEDRIKLIKDFLN